MGKYIKEFELTSQYEEYINSTMALLPNVSLITEINGVHYHPKVILNYLKFTAEEDNSTISLNAQTSPDIKYSLNEGEWTQWDYSAITLNTGDTLRMKGNNSNGFSTNYDSYNQFQMTGKIGASGNIMSLLYEDDFEGQVDLSEKNYVFFGLFQGCTSLTTAPELPATTMTSGCYQGMFQGCTSLITAPELPATTISGGCYQGMFQGCTSLITAPTILPATTLAGGCYSNMFQGCTSLTTAPELPATTLAVSCYGSMFQGCTSLTTISELPATMLAINCYYRMFSGCSSLTQAPELPATTLASSCYKSMFTGCTSLTTAPELPATTLASNCYDSMFINCPKLNHIKMLATDISASNCLYYWVENVASTGTFIKHPDMTSLSSGISGIPSGWTVQDAA